MVAGSRDESGTEGSIETLPDPAFCILASLAQLLLGIFSQAEETFGRIKGSGAVESCSLEVRRCD